MSADDRQIVWFFDGIPTIVVCINCERVASHYAEDLCSICDSEMVEFTADPMMYSWSISEN